MPSPHLLSPPSLLLLTCVRKQELLMKLEWTHTQACISRLTGISSFSYLVKLPDYTQGIRLQSTTSPSLLPSLLPSLYSTCLCLKFTVSVLLFFVFIFTCRVEALLFFYYSTSVCRGEASFRFEVKV